MDSALLSRIREQTGISLLPGMEVIDYEGSRTIEGIVVRDQTSEKKVIAVDGIFLVTGWETNTKFLQFQIDRTPAGYLKTDSKLMTSYPGIFAAGDVRESDMYQVITACADGARAAKYCSEFLEERNLWG
jgi:thioredoxin reductase (NADPH)